MEDKNKGIKLKKLPVERYGELLKILDFKEMEVEILTPKKQAGNEYTYKSKAEEFRLSVIRVEKNTSYSSSVDQSIEVMLCLEGRASLKNLETNKTFKIEKGTSFLIPAAINQYSIKGEATLYKASVP